MSQNGPHKVVSGQLSTVPLAVLFCEGEREEETSSKATVEVGRRVPTRPFDPTILACSREEKFSIDFLGKNLLTADAV